MNNGVDFFIVLMILFLIVISLNILSLRRKTKHREKIKADWELFLQSVSSNDIKNTDYYGKELVWNVHLPQNQLSEMILIITDLASNNPKLKDLELLLYNKQLHFNEQIPY